MVKLELNEVFKEGQSVKVINDQLLEFDYSEEELLFALNNIVSSNYKYLASRIILRTQCISDRFIKKVSEISKDLTIDDIDSEIRCNFRYDKSREKLLSRLRYCKFLISERNESNLLSFFTSGLGAGRESNGSNFDFHPIYSIPYVRYEDRNRKFYNFYLVNIPINEVRSIYFQSPGLGHNSALILTKIDLTPFNKSSEKCKFIWRNPG